MGSVSLFVFFVLSHLVLLHSAEEEEVKRENSYCLPVRCGKLGNISFPFTKFPHPLPLPFCGLMQVEYCDETHPMIKLPRDDQWSERPYEVINISQTNTTQHIRVKDLWLLEYLKTNKCRKDSFAFPSSPFISFKLTTPNRTLFKCNRHPDNTFPRNFKKITCRGYNIYYSPSNEASQNFSSECTTIQLPVNEIAHEDELNLIAEFDLEVELHVSDDCSRCHVEEGKGIDIGITQKCFDAHTHVHS